MERMETPAGRKYDAWFIDGQQIGTLGAVMQAGQRFEDPSQIDFLGTWEDVRLGGDHPPAVVKKKEKGGGLGAGLQPGPGPLLYRLPRNPLLSALCRRCNELVAEVCPPH